MKKIHTTGQKKNFEPFLNGLPMVAAEPPPPPLTVAGIFGIVQVINFVDSGSDGRCANFFDCSCLRRSAQLLNYGQKKSINLNFKFKMNKLY